MAKAGFWLRGAKGKLAGTTLYRGKSGTVQREIVGVTNPKTKAQVAQRIVFSSAALFFKRAKQGLFQFAFSDKKQNWSDYNAFMANNKIAVYPTYDEAHDPYFPLVGQFTLTKGSLNPISPLVANEGESYGGHACLVAPAYFEDEEGESFTWNDFLEENKDYEVGDIITFVAIVSDAYYDALTGEHVSGTHSPKWFIKQVQIKSGDSLVKDDLTANGLKFCHTSPHGGFGLDISDVYGANDIVISDENKYVIGVAVIRSRRNGSTVEVSESSVVLACAASKFAEYLYENYANAVASWGAKDDAVLDGGLLKKV